MATLSQLDQAGAVHKLDPGLPETTQPERMVYISPRVRKWIEEKLPDQGSTWNIEETPQEQLVALTEAFCRGDELAYDHQFKTLHHKEAGIWELKTADVRVFGWFAHKDCFVAAEIDVAQRVKDHNLYHGYCGATARFRDELDLDDPKYVPGDDPDAVVSNYSYP